MYDFLCSLRHDEDIYTSPVNSLISPPSSLLQYGNILGGKPDSWVMLPAFSQLHTGLRATRSTLSCKSRPVNSMILLIVLCRYSAIVSNHPIPQDELLTLHMTKDFRKYINPSLKGLANKLFPRGSISHNFRYLLLSVHFGKGLEMEQPQLVVDIDEESLKKVRNKLMQYIIMSWSKSSNIPQFSHDFDGC